MARDQVGRPKLRFKGNVKALLRTGNFLGVWQVASLDRFEWRSNTVDICDKLNEKRV